MRTPDRKPIPGSPRFRIRVELPARWAGYVANQVEGEFLDDDAGEPWGREEADRAMKKLEAEGYTLLGPEDGAEDGLGKYEGLQGATSPYVALNYGLLEAEAAAGLWRFLPPNSEEEYLLRAEDEGIVWLPAHWDRLLLDPAAELDENDIQRLDDPAGDPARPAPADANEAATGWRGRPPEDLECWNEDAFAQAAASLRRRGWRLDQALDGGRMGWFLRQWGPLRPFVATRGGSGADDEPKITRPWIETRGPSVGWQTTR